MIRIFDIALKDLLQLSRDFKTFMFLLIMPILFTFLFGYAFGGFGGTNPTHACLSATSHRMIIGSRTNFMICWLIRKLSAWKKIRS